MEENEINSLIQKVSCKFSSLRHIYQEPISLPCGETACLKCILNVNDSTKNQFKCEFCKQLHKLNNKLTTNYDKKAKKLIDQNLNILRKYSLDKLEKHLNYVEKRFNEREELVENRRLYIENELVIQIENLRQHLDRLEYELRESLNESSRNLNENLIYYQTLLQPEFDNVKYFLNKTKNLTEINEELINECEFFSINLENYDQTFTKYLNELKFLQNNDLPNETVVGYLNKIKLANNLNHRQNIEINFDKIQTIKTKLIQNFSQNQPITPRFLALNQNHVLITESHSKSIARFNANSGEFEKFILQNVFKSPEGICFNLKNELYVTDYDLNLIFKFDANFNLIKSFGAKILKKPRGIVCDDLENNLLVYVCDYWNKRCCIFNEHGQYRDEFRPVIDKNFDKITTDNENDFYPWNVALSKLYIYVTDDWTGGNCIRVFKKETKELLKNISNLDLYNPIGLLIDYMNNYLYTVGHLYYENGSLHLFCFDLNDKEAKLIRKIDLNNNPNIFDFVFDRVNSRLYCTGEKQLIVYNF